MAAPKGHPKWGGKPKGHRSPATLDKLAARDYVRQRVTDALEGMLAAQIAHAQGIKYLVVRAKNGGKFLRVTEAMAKAKDLADEEIIEVWEKDPSVQAFTDLLNRALDRPKEQAQDINVSGTLDIVTILRKRSAPQRD